MVNENYEQVVRNNDRGKYLKSNNTKKDTQINNGNLPEGPVLQEEENEK